jgi:8-oxo-dGTP pyrophosphatase MutT (NUDIX family)
MGSSSIHTPTSQDDAPILGVGGVVYRRESTGQLELLLIKKRGGFWTLPKGQIKPGEDERTALAREVFEETGITGVIEALALQVHYDIHKRGRRRSKIVTYYCVRALHGSPRPDTAEGIEHVRWFPIEAALDEIQRPRIRSVVRSAWAMLEDSALSAQ